MTTAAQAAPIHDQQSRLGRTGWLLWRDVAVRATAAESRFREAVTWQNPALVHDCLDKAVAGERRKPMAVDFRSLALVNLLAKTVRKTAQETAGDVTLSEMLPDLGQLWLRDAAGEQYTSEFRVVAVLDPKGGTDVPSGAYGGR